MSKYFILILITVTLNAASQLLMKTGMSAVGKFEFSAAKASSLIFGAFMHPLVLLGLATMTLSMLTHLMSLSRFEVSFAFPFISLAYVIVALYGHFVFGEHMSPMRIAGIAAIILGTVLISRT
jgi:drug/metabolite transporter (DMT)-like permease